jgi:hypothetical protein
MIIPKIIHLGYKIQFMVFIGANLGHFHELAKFCLVFLHLKTRF